MPNNQSPSGHEHDPLAEAGLSLTDFELAEIFRKSFETDAKKSEEPSRLDSKLPITPHLPEIAEALEKHGRVIVTGETGIGKTTQIPQFFARLGYRVIHTLPTRLAVTSLQAEVERQYGGKNGEIVGFKHRRGEALGEDFKIMFCTDGLCFERILSEGAFSSPATANSRDLLIIDEFHISNLNIEYIVALYKKYFTVGTAPKMIIMSATMDATGLARFLSVPGSADSPVPAPVFNIPGRQFPIIDLEPQDTRLNDILEHIDRGRGHLIDFYPGAGEIRKMKKELDHHQHGAMVIPLHAKLSPRAQNLVHEQTNKIKIVLATNVAETCLTIPGVSTVINGGLERVLHVEGDEEMLLTRVNSRSTYHQRRGRCGRDGEGFFINRGLPLNLLPDGYWDAQLLPLHKHFLKLFVAGEDPISLELPHEPGANKRLESVEWLKRHGFISADRAPTQLGVFAASLPVEPREAKVILRGMEYRDSNPELLSSVIDVAAILSVRDFRQRGGESLYNLVPSQLHHHIQHSEVLGNLCALETIYHESSSSIRSSLLRRYGIREAAAEEALQLREEIASQLDLSISPVGKRALWTLPAEPLLEASASCWSDHIYQFATRDRSGGALYQNSSDPSAPLRRLSRYAQLGEPLLVTGKPFSIGLSANINSEDDIWRLITQASVIPRAWFASNPKLQELEERVLEERNTELRNRRKQLGRTKASHNSRARHPRKNGKGTP